ncbi:hypothetical protein [Pontimicrobium sp. MEBiC01747]
MKKTTYNKLMYLGVILFSFLLMNTTSYSEKYFKIEFIQNNKIIKIKDNKVKLKKVPFKFKITLYKTNHVFVSNSWDKYYYDYPTDKNIFECNDSSFFKDCRFVSIKTGNEDKFNENKDIYVGDGSYQSVWFYKKENKWHRFDDTVTVKNGIINAEMTVENIFDLDKRDERKYKEDEYNFPIENIEKDIYVVFATEHYEKGMEHPKELQRENFILEFN